MLLSFGATLGRLRNPRLLRERATVGSESKGLFKQLRAGMVFEAAGPDGSGFGEITEATASRIDGRMSASGPTSGRVLVRIPLGSSLLTFSARISLLPHDGPGLVRMESFAGAVLVERRTADRLYEPVRVSVKTGSEKQAFRVLPALNVSARGLLLGWPDAPDAALGEHLEMTLTLSGIDYSVSGEVVRIDAEKTGIRFVSTPDSTLTAIIAHVFKRQHERKKIDDPFLDMEEGMEE